MFTIKEKIEKRQNSDGTICTSGLRSAYTLGRYEGSFTLEAALIFPLIMFCFCLAIQTGVQLQEAVKEQAEEFGEKTSLDMIACMYRKEYLEAIIGDFYGD